MLFSNAIQRDTTIVLESDMLKNINIKLKNYSVQCIIDKVPMTTSEICQILHNNVDELTFIEIMSNAKITKARI